MSHTNEKIKRIVEAGIWSAEKLNLLRCYLRGFLTATKRAPSRYYIDLFAGPGRNRVRETGEEIDGSPLIAMKAGPPDFTCLFLVDKSQQNTMSLAEYCKDYPGRCVNIYCGNANEEIDKILQNVPKKDSPTFAFLDPLGGELEWRTVVKLAQHKAGHNEKIELFILFAYNQGLVRLMPNDPKKMEHDDVLDRVMPSSTGWRTVYQSRVNMRINRHQLRRAMLSEYVDCLKSLGYKYVPPARLISTPNYRPLYFLVFAIDHPAGTNIMEWCLNNVRDSRIQGSFLPYYQRY
jgi:three-Cys-motif partner protein